jgi:hypothetical protein
LLNTAQSCLAVTARTYDDAGGAEAALNVQCGEKMPRNIKCSIAASGCQSMIDARQTLRLEGRYRGTLGALNGLSAVAMKPTTYRIALSPFQAIDGDLHSVVGDLGAKGYVVDQLCLVGTPSAITPLSSFIEPSSAIDPGLSDLLANLEPLYLPSAGMPVVASAGPISDILLKQQSWLSSPAAAPLRRHLENGNVVLAVNGLNDNQFTYAARLFLRHCSGNLSTHVFRWPQDAER